MNAIRVVCKTKKIQSFSRMLSSKITSSKNTCSMNLVINKIFNNQVPIATVYNHVFEYQNHYSTSSGELVDSVTYEKVCDETLESLSDYFEELVEASSHLKDADVSFGSGVLTINFGAPYGTYVINRQSPNRQIWLSSPTSGPKRYDFSVKHKCWIYSHDNNSLHQLLQEEIKDIVKKEVNFAKCAYSFVKS